MTGLLRSYDCFLDDSEEHESWKRALERLSSADIFVAYMPSITFDLWPAYVLECTKAKDFIDCRYKEHLYIVPATGEWGKQEVSSCLIDWYLADRSPDESPLAYGAKLAETILLKTSEKAKAFHVKDIGDVHAVFADFIMPNHQHAYFLVVAEEPHDFWRQIEKYDIVCDFLIHSHKGLGDWFEHVPLAQTIRNSPKRQLLPKYYFKGKFISTVDIHDAELLYTVPESKEHQCVSQIYATNWR